MRGCRKLGPPSVGLEGGWEVGRGQELWIVPAEPDVVGGVDTEAGDIFQEDTLFDSLFTILMEILQTFLIFRGYVSCAANFEGCNTCGNV